MKFINTCLAFVSVFAISLPAIAADSCFTQEINPKTGKIYASEKEYQADLEAWRNAEPDSPGMIDLARAFSIYKKEKARADGFKSDKLAHCYMGCRISQGVNFRVAEYVGWFGENRDLRDCNRDSHFDLGDHKATLVGAQIGQSEKSATGCFSTCDRSY